MDNNRQQNLTVQQALDIAMQHHNAGELNKAELIYQQLLQNNPNNPDALHLLGVIGFQVGQFEEAEKLITRGIAIKPDMDEAHNNLANVLEGLGRLEEAISHFQTSIKIKPGVARIHLNLGNAHKGLGQLDKALLHYHKTISIDSQFAEAHRQIAGIKKHTNYDDDIKNMETIFTKQGTTDYQKMHLAFGLGKAFEDIKQYEKSFKFIEKGNDIKRNKLNTPVVNWDEQILRVKNTFSKALFKKFDGVGSQDKTPIFILGMPRSGTSLVEQILASHPVVHGAGEVQTLNKSISKFFNMANLLEVIPQASASAFEQLGNEYVKSIRTHSEKAGFITDKMPGNFKFIGMIKLILPNAKIIHCHRNPMDNCLSLYKNLFSKGHEFAYNQVELGEYYNCYKHLMNHWQKVLPDFIYNIQYEDVVADQELQTRKLLQHCELEWDEACLKFHQTKRAVKTVSAVQVRKPIYTDSVQSWKRYEKQLAPLLKTLEDI